MPDTESRRPAPTASALACVECRRKHVRCNSTSAPCLRCSQRGLYCHFIPSRRGHGRRSSAATGINPDHGSDFRQRPLNVDPSPQSQCATTPVPAPSQTEAAVTSSLAEVGDCTTTRPAQLPAWLASPPQRTETRANCVVASQDQERLIGAYFTFFHQHHPVLVPSKHFDAQAHPLHLKLVVQLIGNQYVPIVPAQELESAYRASLEELSGHSLQFVQSTLLYALFLYGKAEHKETACRVAAACDAAIYLGLNELDAATKYSNGDFLLSESIRRTWWELYVLNGVLSATQRQVRFRCNDVRLAAGLPCEEIAYTECTLPRTLVTLDQFDERFFAYEGQPFSSASYRIDAVRIMGRILDLSRADSTEIENVKAVDSAIAAWKIHLPADKAQIVDFQGRVDHMMFQACTFIDTASIILHYPRSELLFTHSEASNIACASSMLPAPPTFRLHATKAICASRDLADLASLTLNSFTPLVIPGFVFACVVQLSACAKQAQSDSSHHRDRTALMAGLLKANSQTWPPLINVLQAVNRAAAALFRQKRPTDILDDFPHENFDIDALLQDLARSEALPGGAVTG
ncbi:hypothetical protein KC360_g9041 [Hortaea werneckii]|nr:hypothetical protein KC325_g9041 [Hortaea werneckii]KAI6985417.1 hypothetical protein KC359_g9156 [Hortaea werneckii]KAI7139963.1 hypothetical protein KC344_g9039 [Hortaea werneckii]KAI7166769.1 hypothetical protein KC360_g9041 [Hortaea werneckii]